MKEIACWWRKICRWPGWTGWMKWSGWKRMAHWNGWKKLLFPSPWMVFGLAAAAVPALILIFLTGRELAWFAYPVYVLSFYALVTVCVRIPAGFGIIRRKMDRNPLVNRYRQNELRRFRGKLYLDQGISFLYGVLKVAAGVFYSSVWITADGIYNLIQWVLQLLVVLRRQEQSAWKQWKQYRFCGGLMMALAVPVAGMVYMAVSYGSHREYPGYLIFVTALFVFYRLPVAFMRVAKDRKHPVPMDSAVRMLKLSQAEVSMFSLQAAMLYQFGGGQNFARLMNTLTGSAVCILAVATGIYMLCRGEREMKKESQERVKDGEGNGI